MPASAPGDTGAGSRTVATTSPPAPAAVSGECCCLPSSSSRACSSRPAPGPPAATICAAVGTTSSSSSSARARARSTRPAAAPLTCRNRSTRDREPGQERCPAARPAGRGGPAEGARWPGGRHGSRHHGSHGRRAAQRAGSSGRRRSQRCRRPPTRRAGGGERTMGGWRGGDDDHGRAGDFYERGAVRGQHPVAARPQVLPPVRDQGDWGHQPDQRSLSNRLEWRVPAGGAEVRPGVPRHSRTPRSASPRIRAQRRWRRRRARVDDPSAVRGFGEPLITLGLVVLLFAAYEVYGKAFEVNAEQSRLDNALDEQWDAPPARRRREAGGRQARPRQGHGAAVHPAAEQGLGRGRRGQPHDIKLAPGHYPESQLPGQLGNFAVAGHRTPSVFWDVDKLENGDAMVVETRTGWYVYQVTKVHIITPEPGRGQGGQPQ